ncbi:unnamed protein product [Pedinophyceae sp. YPF-701]|nr:unnamed protein product [Pedinophyceae sp. YPF-701]
MSRRLLCFLVLAVCLLLTAQVADAGKAKKAKGRKAKKAKQAKAPKAPKAHRYPAYGAFYTGSDAAGGYQVTGLNPGGSTQATATHVKPSGSAYKVKYMKKKGTLEYKVKDGVTVLSTTAGAHGSSQGYGAGAGSAHVAADPHTTYGNGYSTSTISQWDGKAKVRVFPDGTYAVKSKDTPDVQTAHAQNLATCTTGSTDPSCGAGVSGGSSLSLWGRRSLRMVFGDLFGSSA